MTDAQNLSIIRSAPNAVAIANEPTDLASLTDAEFQRGLDRIDMSKRRMQRILESSLVPGAHFGNPNGAFQKPILYQAGAEELQKGFRLQIAMGDQPDSVESSADFVQVTVHRAILDGAGRVIGRTTASCSTKEKRFKKRSGQGFVYDDARECLNDCWSMAEKRASVRLTRAALGVTAFLANEDEMEAGLEPERPLVPMTADERKTLYALAAQKGIGKKAFTSLIEATLGRLEIGTGNDVAMVGAAIGAWQKPETEAPKVEPDPSAPAVEESASVVEPAKKDAEGKAA